MNVHYSSATPIWETPIDFFNKYDDIYHFDLDVCATEENKKCNKYYSEKDDGLSKPWIGTCWMNPPYGRTIGQWIKKAYESSQEGATVVCLIPARTDTKWWHDYVVKGLCKFIKGRLKFGVLDHATNKSTFSNSAPFPNAVVIFGQGQLVHPQWNSV